MISSPYKLTDSANSTPFLPKQKSRLRKKSKTQRTFSTRDQNNSKKSKESENSTPNSVKKRRKSKINKTLSHHPLRSSQKVEKNNSKIEKENQNESTIQIEESQILPQEKELIQHLQKQIKFLEEQYNEIRDMKLGEFEKIYSHLQENYVQKEKKANQILEQKNEENSTLQKQIDELTKMNQEEIHKSTQNQDKIYSLQKTIEELQQRLTEKQNHEEKLEQQNQEHQKLLSDFQALSQIKEITTQNLQQNPKSTESFEALEDEIQINTFYQIFSGVQVKFTGSVDEQKFSCSCSNHEKTRILDFDLILTQDINEDEFDIEYEPKFIKFDNFSSNFDDDSTISQLKIPEYLKEPICFDKFQAPIFLTKILSFLFTSPSPNSDEIDETSQEENQD
ncbi:monopolin complex subunit csm1 [Anaeramoeba ignava]|uniref:Monopolin complex subunit csm1 n=1 Tax=Anaeramoeba ignava TaxID=1746090 RepID=A0A9Q0RE34_ANAIG|nr:monopolin complex subunit csm1 [Anaeramoeba ignava]